MHIITTRKIRHRVNVVKSLKGSKAFHERGAVECMQERPAAPETILLSKPSRWTKDWGHPLSRRAWQYRRDTKKGGATVEQHKDNGGRIPHREDANHKPNTLFGEWTPDTMRCVDEEGLNSLVIGVHLA